MSSCRAGLHRDPLILYPPCQHVKRASGMPLDACLYLVEDLEQKVLFSVACDMALNNQSSAKEGHCNGATKKGFSSSDIQPRVPLGPLSQNTMCNTTGVSYSDNLEVNSKNVPAPTIQQCDDEEGNADSCLLIKPGNTKEKVAFFASHHCGNRNNSMKVKNTGDVSGRAAKRRKKSVDLKRGKSCMEVPKKCFLSDSFPSGIENCSISYFADGDGILPPGPLSVIEMVAFLEQRESSLHSDCSKPFSNPPSSKPAGPSKCAHLSVSLMALEASDASPNKDHSEKSELESVCVLEMVAKLESECLRRQNERESGGLSRSNSLRRNVGRMLLANGSQQNFDHSAEPPIANDPEKALAASAMANLSQNKEDPCSERMWEDSLSLAKHDLEAFTGSKVNLELVKETCLKMGCKREIAVTVDPCKCSISVCIKAVECVSDSFDRVNDRAADEKIGGSCGIPDSPSVKTTGVFLHALSQEVGKTQDMALMGDPSPGKIFFQNEPKHSHVQISPELKPLPQGLDKKTFDNTLYLQNGTMIAQYSVSISSLGNVTQVLDSSSTIKRPVSHDFLETRFKIQQLLEPQQYMAFLPHHILVKIFHYLPTRTLSALKCTSCYFKFIIEHYDIRPCDSLWVRDPRYKDDPCKQCKKKYAKGDVSLCLWHPKPYCQALPYGPGFWMCCHMSQKECQGCRVGLHDNRWVPPFHSLNRTVCKKSECEFEED